MDDALRVRLREADDDVGGEAEPSARRKSTIVGMSAARLADLSAHAARASSSPAPASRPRAASPTSGRPPASGRSSTRSSTRRWTRSSATPSGCGGSTPHVRVLPTPAERRPPGAGGARGARPRAGGRHAEHRPAAPARRQPRRDRGARLDRELHSARAAARRSARATCCRRSTGRGAALPGLRRVLKPDVVFFGELLPAAAIDRADRARARARLCLVVGSALEVYPVAGAAARDAARGRPAGDRQPRPDALDERAELKIDGRPARSCQQCRSCRRVTRLGLRSVPRASGRAAQRALWSTRRRSGRPPLDLVRDPGAAGRSACPSRLVRVKLTVLVDVLLASHSHGSRGGLDTRSKGEAKVTLRYRHRIVLVILGAADAHRMEPRMVLQARTSTQAAKDFVVRSAARGTVEPRQATAIGAPPRVPGSEPKRCQARGRARGTK